MGRKWDYAGLAVVPVCGTSWELAPFPLRSVPNKEQQTKDSRACVVRQTLKEARYPH